MRRLPLLLAVPAVALAIWLGGAAASAYLRAPELVARRARAIAEAARARCASGDPQPARR